MKLKFIPTTIVTLLLASVATAQDTAIQATVVSLQGTAAAVSPGRPGATALAVGAKLGANSFITTSPGSTLGIRFFDGTIALLQPESEMMISNVSEKIKDGKVLKEVVRLSLRKGMVVSSLDPTKKKINDYQVRTPKKVANATGTVFAVRVDVTGDSVTTMSGIVTLTDPASGQQVQVSFGQNSAGSGVQTVAQAVAANPALAAELVQAAGSVAAAIGQGQITNTAGNPNAVNSVLAAVVAVAAQASPSQAASIASAALSAAAPALGANANSAAQVITQAAVQGAVTSDSTLAGTAAAQVAQSVSSTASNLGLTVSNQGLTTAANQGTTTATQQATGGTTAPNTILPPLDQTQVVVSPSHP